MRTLVHTIEFQKTELLKEYYVQGGVEGDESVNEDAQWEGSKGEEKEKKIWSVHLLKSFEYFRNTLQSQADVPEQLFNSLNSIKSYLESCIIFNYY